MLSLCTRRLTCGDHAVVMTSCKQSLSPRGPTLTPLISPISDSCQATLVSAELVTGSKFRPEQSTQSAASDSVINSNFSYFHNQLHQQAQCSYRILVRPSLSMLIVQIFYLLILLICRKTRYSMFKKCV